MTGATDARLPWAYPPASTDYRFEIPVQPFFLGDRSVLLARLLYLYCSRCMITGRFEWVIDFIKGKHRVLALGAWDFHTATHHRRRLCIE